MRERQIEVVIRVFSVTSMQLSKLNSGSSEAMSNSFSTPEGRGGGVGEGGGKNERWDVCVCRGEGGG